jgi:hypothetical protein
VEKVRIRNAMETETDLGLAKIADSTVDATLEKMNFGKYHLVIEPLQFGKQVVDK